MEVHITKDTQMMCKLLDVKRVPWKGSFHPTIGLQVGNSRWGLRCSQLHRFASIALRWLSSRDRLLPKPSNSIVSSSSAGKGDTSEHHPFMGAPQEASVYPAQIDPEENKD